MNARFPTLSLPRTSRKRERLAKDLRSLAREAERLIGGAAENVSDRAYTARRHLGDAIERVRDTCEDLQERSAASARKAMKKTNRAVRARPYETAGVVFVVGLILGWLMRRSR